MWWTTFLACLGAVLGGHVPAVAQGLPVRHDLSLPVCSGAGAVAFTPDSKFLACYRNRGDLRLWDTTTGKLLDTIKTSAGTNSYVTDRGMAFSPDGRMFAAVNIDQTKTATVTVTELASGRAVAKHTHPGYHVHVVAWSPDGKLLVSGDVDEVAKARVLMRDATGLLRK